jgi:4-amino-4-deoxy-L-arabinose transferase-like glycosyltransferase
MSDTADVSATPVHDTRLPWIASLAAAAHAALNLATSFTYPIFRDELYYLACADHLDWGYVDHPPLSVALLWLVRATLGDSVLALRLLPAVTGGLLVLLGARIARELGGGRSAAGLAAVAVAIAPQYLGLAGIYSMNVYNLVAWACLAWILVRLVKTDDPRLWLPLGAVAGLGLLNKVSVLFFLAGLGVAVLATPLRRHLRTPWPWVGGGLALLLFAPHLLWQIQHGWPTLEFIRNAQARKIAAISPLSFLGAQVLEIHPLNLPLWLGGLAALLAGRELRRFRALGIVYLTALALMVVQKSKPYYLGAAYPMLLAAGATAAEGLLAGRRWLRTAIPSVLASGGVALAPFAVPLLPVESFIAYQRAVGMEPGTDENHQLGPLPQFFADRFGWEELATAVGSVYHALPPEERARTIIVAANYGEAGAVDYYGRRLGLPRASSPHNNYHLWGLALSDPEVVIAVGISSESLERTFESVTVAARWSSPYAMPYQTRHPIHVCRGFKRPPAEVWREARSFI